MCDIHEFKLDEILIGKSIPPPPPEDNIGEVARLSFIVTKSMHDSFTKITGDISPVHLSAEYAKEKGFKDVLVYGMLTASFYSTLVGVFLPGKYAIFQKCEVSFNKPVYIGDTLSLSGTISDIHYALKRITIKAAIRNQYKEKVSSATLIVGITE
ncbi:MAG: MaoC family dehydratase N-terminal domain-containing protein [Bacteroidales bacterium]|jgi:acyl dehydratase|nr:MaoC family dehydratase N-terminal domain-containing protein [Bacteroidales bacterium]